MCQRENNILVINYKRDGVKTTATGVSISAKKYPKITSFHAFFGIFGTNKHIRSTLENTYYVQK